MVFNDRSHTLCGKARRVGASKCQSLGDLPGEAQHIDNAIDQLVYELYDLADEEIARVEAEFGVPAQIAG